MWNSHKFYPANFFDLNFFLWSLKNLTNFMCRQFSKLYMVRLCELMISILKTLIRFPTSIYYQSKMYLIALGFSCTTGWWYNWAQLFVEEKTNTFNWNLFMWTINDNFETNPLFSTIFCVSESSRTINTVYIKSLYPRHLKVLCILLI